MATCIVDRTKPSGFTLIEILLVLVIMGAILLMLQGYAQQKTQTLRIEHEATNIQAILNGGLAYYIANNSWPANMDALVKGGYLPRAVTSSYNPDYILKPNTNGTLFAVATEIAGQHVSAISRLVAGTLSLGYTSDKKPFESSPNIPCPSTATTCYAIGSINVPGLNLSNATAINFAGVYHNGACVPAPACPQELTDKNGNQVKMKPTIYTVPEAALGLSKQDNVYPLNSFMAYASSIAPMAQGSVKKCGGSSTGASACSLAPNQPANTKYWRVCLQLTTEDGSVEPSTNDWGKKTGAIVAFTRCAVENEPYGSGFDVWEK